MKVSPYVTVGGTVSNFNPDNHAFTITPTQYIALSHTSSAFPIHGHFIDSDSKKRWGSNGPKAAAGSTVAFGGFLERVSRERDMERSLAFAEVEVTNIAYLSNRGSTFTTPGSMCHFLFSPEKFPDNDLASNNPTSRSRRRWNYNDPPERSSMRKGKRKQEEEHDNEHPLKREKTAEEATEKN